MFKIPFHPHEGATQEVNCRADHIPLTSIRTLSKRARKYLAETWNIYSIEGMFFLTITDIKHIPTAMGQHQIRELWELLNKKTVLYESHFKTLKKLKYHNHRYNGEQKCALLGLALVLPLIEKRKIKSIIQNIPGYAKASPGKRKIILEAA